MSLTQPNLHHSDMKTKPLHEMIDCHPTVVSAVEGVDAVADPERPE
jgi:hypothetical protein